MPSYTNNNHEVVSVSQDHIETAIELKKELQKMSPSRRCNWKEHKRLMEEEGYDDSCSNESYRCMIKTQQAKEGSLDSKEKHAELISENKLKSIKKAVGEMYYSKRELQTENLKMGRLQRDLTKTGVIAEEIRDAMIDNLTIELSDDFKKPKRNSNGHKVIAILTDWHIGATVENVNGNSYNLEIAKFRLNKFLEEVYEYAYRYDAKTVKVVCLGDMIEHISMRNVNQAFEAELNMSEQITEASKMIFEFLAKLTTEFNVDYTGIAGNHDRMTASKPDAIDGDNAMVVINNTVEMLIEMSNIPRLSFTKSADKNLYEHKEFINGVSFKFVHGDLETKSQKKKIESHMAMDQSQYDCLVYGHYHHFEVIERNYGTQEICVGSPMGRNNYSKKIKATSNPSQAVIIVREDGQVTPVRVDLSLKDR